MEVYGFLFVILSSSKVREQRYTLLLYLCNLLILFCLSWESFVITLKNCKEIYYLHYSLYTLYKYHCIVLKDFPRLKFSYFSKYSVQFSSVTQLCLTLCDPMNHSTPGLPVHHQLLQFTQTHFHWVDDAIQPSHPLSSPSSPAPNPSQHQGLFQWLNSSHEVAKVLEFQLQHQSFQWAPRTDLL